MTKVCQASLCTNPLHELLKCIVVLAEYSFPSIQKYNFIGDIPYENSVPKIHKQIEKDDEEETPLHFKFQIRTVLTGHIIFSSYAICCKAYLATVSENFHTVEFGMKNELKNNDNNITIKYFFLIIY